MLSERDAEFFKLFGFLKIPKFFGVEELAVLEAEYDLGLSRVAPLYSAPIGMRGQLNWSNMRPRTPVLSKMLEDPRMLSMARLLLSEGAVGVMSNGNNFSGKFTEWHADTSVPGFRSVKFAAYLDPLDGQSGALRVLPGSHRSPWHEQLLPIGMKNSMKDAGNPEASLKPIYHVPDVPAFICDTQPGDVLAFDLKIWHASWNGSPNRRMLSFTYFDTPSEADLPHWRSVGAQFGKEALNREVRRQREWIKLGKTPDEIPTKEPQYHCKWLSEAQENPLRAEWMSKITSWGLARDPQNQSSSN